MGLGHNVITPIVIGPAELPDVGPELSHDRPELAVLAAMAHPSEAERFEVALGAVAQLDEDLATDYTLYLLAAELEAWLTAAARAERLEDVFGQAEGR